MLDLTSLHGGLQERRTIVLFGWVSNPQGQPLSVGAATVGSLMLLGTKYQARSLKELGTSRASRVPLGMGSRGRRFGAENRGESVAISQDLASSCAIFAAYKPR